MINLIRQRRSIYALHKEMPFDDKILEEKIAAVLKDMPSAFNSQSARVVLLLGQKHQMLWDIVLKALKDKANPEKIKAFADAHGTILFFENEQTTAELKEKLPLYAQHFEAWADQGNGMLQFALWAMLAEHHIGASLQHYNPLIDITVRESLNLPKNWKLIAQMPFGGILKPAEEKTYLPLEERLKVFQ